MEHLNSVSIIKDIKDKENISQVSNKKLIIIIFYKVKFI